MGYMQPGSLTPPNHVEMPMVTASTNVSKASNFSVFSMVYRTWIRLLLGWWWTMLDSLSGGP